MRLFDCSLKKRIWCNVSDGTELIGLSLVSHAHGGVDPGREEEGDRLWGKNLPPPQKKKFRLTPLVWA